MTDKPMTYEEASAKVAAEAKHPRITKELIEGNIASVDYLMHGITTICVLTLSNGFKVIGHSTPASPENFMEDVGKGYAYDNAFRQCWQLFGFQLKTAIQPFTFG